MPITTRSLTKWQSRPARTRLVSNENDENSSSGRMTRAKAAALNVDESAAPSKGALQAKTSAANATATAGSRRRAALGDVSNVGKTDGVEGKKGAAGKVGLVSKAAQPTGIQKASTRPASRTALSTKTTQKTEVKRTGSGSGAIGAVQKRKVSTATSAVTREESAELSEPVRKKAHTLDADKRLRTELKSDDEDSAPAPAAESPKATAESVADYKLPSDVPDLDQEDLDDPLMVAEYAPEIFEYLRVLETKTIPNADYMAYQDDLEWKMRGILVDWLIEVHTRFHLLPETLYLAVNIIDRFLSEKVVPLARLQLVGITAMFIASKYEEVLSPHVENFKRIADDEYREDEILSAERFILGSLDYDLSYPNPMNFLRRISKADNYDDQVRTIGKYLMEISLLDHRFMSYKPSHVAAAAMYLARLMLQRGEWNSTFAHYAGYTEDEVEPVVQLMVDYIARPLIHEAFFKKYACKKFLKASILARQWAKKNAHVFGVTDTHLSLEQIS
ncbi:hypothetical protein S7711_02412 [Stachybotrys chartarum IBT 7711]|uniref:Uncharacterized protein n=1 Tax=Stachybotrys chartarum (strain CBS 109288 / IBT 7711) TaxID=1280523 RepID=A0A084AQB3_STACB|nr:hypothetical protein S7711_02412 [Stachybotrys chartarum IBT 7711]KFA47714.1 hypothetical protein S40293_08094 [Stachybotrys chartarum IBT 40293]